MKQGDTIVRVFALAMSFLAAASAVADAQLTTTVEGVDFQPPSGWSQKPRDDGGFVLLAPIKENNWRAYILVESVTDPLDRPVQQLISALIPNLASRYAEFRELRRDEKSTESGLQYASLEYSYHDADTPAVVEWVTAVRRPGKTRAMIYCNSEAGLVGKYQPVCAAFLESMVPTASRGHR